MTLQNLNQLLKKAGKLKPSERLLLASRLIQGVRNEVSPRKSFYKWKDAAGLLSYPAFGEDAQTYISRARREEDTRRANIIRDGE
jgi:hypothetical protein